MGRRKGRTTEDERERERKREFFFHNLGTRHDRKTNKPTFHTILM